MSLRDAMSIPIIDAHQHSWDLSKVDYPWLGPDAGPLFRTYPVAELAPQLADAGVTATILVQAANSFADTVYMLDQADCTPWIIGVVGWVPLLEPEETARAVARFGQHPRFRGVRHLIHNEPDPYWLLQAPVKESLALLAEAGLPLDVVATKHEHFQCIHRLSEEIPGLRMIIDHLGHPPFGQARGQWGEDMRIAAENPNVFAKISGLGTATRDWDGWTVDDIRDEVDWTIDLFGPGRCMCGGDWPVSVLAGGYVKSWSAYQKILSYHPQEEQEQILNGTAQAFYGVALPTV
jgi:L-fuconolactonase